MLRSFSRNLQRVMESLKLQSIESKDQSLKNNLHNEPGINLKEYKKGTVNFWNEKGGETVGDFGIGKVQQNPDRFTFWQTAFEFKPLESLYGIPLRKMCIYTKRPGPKIDELQCLFENTPFSVHLSQKIDPVYLKKSDAEKLLEYTLEVTSILTNKVFTCSLSKAPYLIAPLQNMLDQTVFQEVIDWSEVTRTVAKQMNQSLYDTMVPLEDSIIFQKAKRDELYFLNIPKDGIKEDSLVEGYLVKRKSALEEPKFWNPKLCHVFPMSASVYQGIQPLPEILQQMHELMLVQQFKKIGLNFVSDTILLEALTAPSSKNLKNYERLEFLGGKVKIQKKKKKKVSKQNKIDSVLKFVTSVYLYNKYQDYQEGKLTQLRSEMTENKTLTKHAKSLELYMYIISGAASRRLWRPPTFECDLESDKIRQKLAYHDISDKTMADVVESIIGAAHTIESLDSALSAMHIFGICLELESWSDISNTHQRSLPNNSTDISIDVNQLSKVLGFEFRDHSLVYEALMHRSASVKAYERLEFLGDALLDYLVTRYLYSKYPTADPSTLHSLRKSSVNYQIQSVICLKTKLHNHIIYSCPDISASVLEFERKYKDIVLSGEDLDEYWLSLNPPKILADITESILGAMLVDSGYDVERVESFFEQWIKPILDNHISPETVLVDPTTQLTLKIQEMGCMDWEIK